MYYIVNFKEVEKNALRQKKKKSKDGEAQEKKKDEKGSA